MHMKSALTRGRPLVGGTLKEGNYCVADGIPLKQDFTVTI